MKTYAPITKRQQDILRLVYTYRFLSRDQIQAFLGHKAKQQINTWLRDLRLKGYLVAHYSSRLGENIKPAVYASGLGAIAYFRSRETCHDIVIQRLYGDRTRPASFIDQRMEIADLALELRSATTPRAPYRLATSSDYSNPDLSGSFMLDFWLYPDAVITKSIGYATSTYVYHVLQRGIPDRRQMAILRKYVNLTVGGQWKELSGLGNPHVIIATTSRKQSSMLRRYYESLVQDLHEHEAERLGVTFVEAATIQEAGILWLIRDLEAETKAKKVVMPNWYEGSKPLAPRDPTNKLAIQRKGPEAASGPGPVS